MNPFTPSQEMRFARVAARATKKIPRDAQSEVFSTAYIAARESYEDFDETRGDGTIESRLDNWFYGLVLNAKKKVRREAKPLGASDMLEALPSYDTPEAEAVREESFEQLSSAALAIVAALRDGASVRQAARKCGATVNYVKQIKRQVRNLLSDESKPLTPRREPATVSDDDMRELAPIDHEIEKLLRRPSTSKADCPVCWRCSWFNGLLPIHYQARRLADPEITEATLRVDLRKQDIANGTEPRDLPNNWPKVHGEHRKLDFLLPYNARTWLGSFGSRFKNFSIEKQLEQAA